MPKKKNNVNLYINTFAVEYIQELNQTERSHFIKDVAEIAGVHRSTVYAWLNPNRSLELYAARAFNKAANTVIFPINEKEVVA